MDGRRRYTLLLDVSRLVWRAWQEMLPTGIDRTCLAYVAHYRDGAQAVVQRGSVTRVLPADFSRQLFDALLEQGAPGTVAQLKALAWRSLGHLMLGSGSRHQHDGALYFNVGHTGLDRFGHAQWLVRSGVRPVYFVHDLIPLTHPEYCRPGEPAKHLRRMNALLRNAVGIIGNSRDTLNELAVFAGLQHALTMPPALVAPLGVRLCDPASSAGSAIALPGRPYFVMLGTIEGRKNHLLMLTLWAELARRLGSACPQLVIIGKRGWENEQAIDMLERSEAIRGHVIELSRCDDAALATYVAGARALILPSFVEGYGLPVVEALARGTPVIASDLPVFRELAANIPDYLSPIDGLGWSRAIEDYARTDSQRRNAQLARMAGWSPPTWKEHFRKVDRWLEQFAAIPPPAATPAPSG
jgi:glycosyltransferase involved in cell wall biosynthesis